MKTHIDDLALFGSKPIFDTPLHVGRPEIGDRDALMERIDDILDRKWFTNDGPYVRELEQRIAAIIGVRNCIAVCNGTVGLEIASRALRLSGEVIVPSFTFVATAHALKWQGITPVFCDVDPITHNVSPHSVRAAITEKTTGIVGVHLWGRPCLVEELAHLADEHGLRLMFDAAHAFGCSRGNRMIGTFGDVEVFSFHATKFVHGFEGGAIVTDDDELAGAMRLMRNFGFAGYDTVIYLGVNGKMSEISAAMAITAIDNMEGLVTANRNNHEIYHRFLGSSPGVRVVEYDPANRPNYQYIVAEIDAREAGITRDQLVQILHAENVLARRYFYPGCHRMGPYQSSDGSAATRLTVTEALSEKVLVLPNGRQMGETEIAEICGVIRLSVENGPDIAARLENPPAPSE